MLRLLNFLILFLLATPLCAHELNGTIVDANKQPLEGIGVYNKTNGSYTYSNMSGYFELDGISVGDEIFFYGLGYANQEMTIAESDLDTTIEVVMQEAALSLDQVVLVSKVDALTRLVDIDIQTNPIKSSQEVLRKVPGLIIGQHAGGGKAEQIFLRGFDIDHGTDVAINLDGMPVNMVSHAHGQGYSDMHFIIPETVENIDFGKGPYYASKGNFTTAGYIGLNTKKVLDNNLVTVEAGQFNTLRALGMVKLVSGEQSNAYLASEMLVTDGFFDASQNFNRYNLMGRYHYNNKEDEELTLSISHFQSKWDASGQIPQRAVDQGLIGRFGAIDSTEGGNTSRSNIWANHRIQLDEHNRVTTNAFLSTYGFELFSNFTFLLNNPVDGDQIRQHEQRTLLGMESVYNHSFHLDDHNDQLQYDLGVGFRYDDVNDVELSRTANRTETLERLADGDIDELNFFAYTNWTYKKGDWTFIPGLRMDYFRFDYRDRLPENYTSLSESKMFLGPKFNMIYAANPDTQIFLKSGYGFHSNDTRVVVANNGRQILPGALGADLGIISKPFRRTVFNLTLWTLFLEQEFVYVGDEAIVEPSGKTRRMGVEAGVRQQITDQLFFNTDITYTYARSTEEPDGADFIPLAPDLTWTGGLNYTNNGPISGSINARYIADRPANEDNSIVAEGYFVTDLNVQYTVGAWSFGIIVENLFDTEWNETQFATLSRLPGEPAAGIEEIHFTPGSPFFARGRISVRF
ncbi:Outer membrane receptor proteins, mostly Fe transport [Robiginitalea myxolifaciens]|uniref:Outer membrane receptor proteins, mostly Fe transport n=1 Tax=Robiginitalea myxolifaciens TaxID=400055 RepID=A0A1I6FY68_9FLAO|nr:TonB-dependent receptor plug domain-containing protein [Robiginitalea myxolifaciens]SFR34777.1 Outer membrane receptor proteins, mostly Fe transport [Robiginitalea myxolifaciens]